MRKECLVFSRQVGLDQLLGKIGVLQLNAPFARIGVDDLAIDPAYNRGEWRFIVNKAVRLGQSACEQEPNCDQQQNKNTRRRCAPTEEAPLTPIRLKPGERSRAIALQTLANISQVKCECGAHVLYLLVHRRFSTRFWRLATYFAMNCAETGTFTALNLVLPNEENTDCTGHNLSKLGLPFF